MLNMIALVLGIVGAVLNAFVGNWFFVFVDAVIIALNADSAYEWWKREMK